MALTIGHLARRVGLRPSAVRYYEERGLIAPDARVGGKRLYDDAAVERLALIVFAKEAGFSLDEIRRLLAGFDEGTPAGARWIALASAKLAELDALSQQIETMRGVLQRLMRCQCRDLDQCARGIAAKHCS